MWEKPLLKSKTRAMLIHMSLSALIFVPLLYLILVRWYPGPLFFTDGGWQGVRIMLLVDMVLGPALTFMVFNAAKSRLALTVDFGFIGVVQFVALVYGAWTIEETRIWAIAYNPTFDSFMAVSKNQFAKQDIPAEGWKRFGNEAQYWAYVRPPSSAEMPAVIAAGDKGLPFEAMYPLYEPLGESKARIFPRQIVMDKLVERMPELAPLYKDFLQDHAGASGLHFFRLAGFYRSVIIALDDDARYVGFINHDIH